MKTLKVWIVTAIVLLTFLSTQAIASSDPGRRDTSVNTTESDEARVIVARLNEINAMDKSSLTETEIKDLDKEVKASEKRMRKLGGGTFSSYLSRLMRRFTGSMRR